MLVVSLMTEDNPGIEELVEIAEDAVDLGLALLNESYFFSSSATINNVLMTASGLNDMLFIPHCTRNLANSS